MTDGLTLEEVQRMIDSLDREDRAMHRPWIFAHYDDGNPQTGWQSPKP